jgi:membrane protease YdiL (CAAX protease family)
MGAQAHDVLIPGERCNPRFVAPAWNGWGCASIFVASFAIGMVLSRVIFSLFNVITPVTIDLAVIGRDAAIIIVVFALRGLLRPTGPVVYDFLHPSSQSVAVGVAAGTVLFLISIGANSIEQHVLGGNQSFWRIPLQSHRVSTLAMDLGRGVVATPIAEELLFRGVLFRGLVQRMSLLCATLISAALFSAVHVNLYLFAPLLAMGAGLALLYYWTRALWTSIIAHASINFISIALTYAVDGTK